MIEQWKDIKGYEGMYQISNFGRVKSLARFKRKQDRIVAGGDNNHGYIQVQLRKDNKRKVFLVHRLVMMHFVPVENHEDLEVNHKDFNTKNNRLDNLEWCTSSENIQHWWDHNEYVYRDTTARGETHPLAVMTADKVIEIRRLWDENIITNKSELGRVFGIKETTVRQILNRVTWKDI